MFFGRFSVINRLGKSQILVPDSPLGSLYSFPSYSSPSVFSSSLSTFVPFATTFSFSFPPLSPFVFFSTCLTAVYDLKIAVDVHVLFSCHSSTAWCYYLRCSNRSFQNDQTGFNQGIPSLRKSQYLESKPHHAGI